MGFGAVEFFIQQLSKASLQKEHSYFVSFVDVTICKLELFLNVFIFFGR